MDIWFLSQLSRNVSDNWHYSGLQRCCGDLEKNTNIARYLEYLKGKSNSAYVLPWFHHCFLLLKCRNELIDLNPLSPGPGVWSTQVQEVPPISWGCLENNSGMRGSSKAPFEGYFLMEILWNSEELKWWKVALVCERRQMIASSVLIFVICGSFSGCID